ncbi:MAG: hypothetical protein JWP95_2279 [Actinotalea sp.]|nr:hypothetical protein [Actinotalea sp.]
MRYRPGSGSGREQGVVEVLLVDTDDLDGDLEADARAHGQLDDRSGTTAVPQVPLDEGAVRSGRRRRRLRAVRWVVAGAAVATAVVLANVAETRDREERLADLAAAPGFLDPVQAPLTEAWRIPGRPVSAGTDLLVSDPTDSSLRGVDAATGVVRWTVGAEAGSAAAMGYCFPVDESLWFGTRPPSDPPPTPLPGLVACVGDPPGGVTSGRSATPAVSVVIIDTATGATRHTFTGEGSLITAEPAGDDLLLALATPDARLRAVRWDLETGEPVWEFLSERSIFAQDPLMVESIERSGDIWTIVSIGVVALDLTTGTEVDWRETLDLPATYDVLDLPDGVEAYWTWDSDTNSGVGRVTVEDGLRSYPLPGPPLHPTTHDGSEPGILVVMTADGARVRGLDLATGRWLWSEPSGGEYATPLLQSDGVILLNRGASVAAVDVRTGEELWSARADARLSYGSALTDGELVLLPERDGDSPALDLVARGIHDGVEAWRTALPEDTFSISVADRHVVLSTQDFVVGLGAVTAGGMQP